MQTILEMSKNEQLASQEMSPAIKCALQNGFSLEQAIEAYSIVGENPDMMITYLYDRITRQ